MTNNNKHWNTVDWSRIPEDVEAVVTYQNEQPYYFKKVEGTLFSRKCTDPVWRDSQLTIPYVALHCGDRFHLRPTPSIQPTPEPPESTQVEGSQVEDTSMSITSESSAVATLLSLGYDWRGGQYWKPPLGKVPDYIQEEQPTTPEFDWSTVEDDVEAVIIFASGYIQKYKTVDGVLMIYELGDYVSSAHDNLSERIADAVRLSTTYYVRPPATPPTNKLDDQPISYKVEFYEGTLPEGMIDLDKVTEPSVPSIQSILSDAQELIKKHHNITGEVKFTIKCS